MLEGKLVNLRVIEREDLSIWIEWLNNLEFFGEYFPILQRSKAEMEKKCDSFSREEKAFFIEKKDGNKIGYIDSFLAGKHLEIGYALDPNERRKGYGTEAVKIMVDYLFLSNAIVRIQAHVDPRNKASQKVLEKAGFTREGLVRKSAFIRGEWRDGVLYSILREEWKEPKILTKTTSSN